MRYHPRTLEKTLAVYLRQFPVVVLTGPRRAGKSTMLQHCLKRHRYVTLDALDTRRFAQEDPRGFLQRFSPPTVIDEIQYVPELFPYLKEQVDMFPRLKGQWVLTGSQHFAMMEGLQEALAGRAGLLSLLPFSVAEATGFPRMVWAFPVENWWKRAIAGELEARTQQHWAQFVLPTLYPEPFLSRKSMDPAAWVDSYIQTVIDRDLKSHIAARNHASFGKFVTLLASRVAQQTNAAALARDVGIDTKTAMGWLGLLLKARIIFELPPYYRNLGKRITKSPKIYFFDTGLACHLSGISTEEQLVRGPMAGALFENFVVSGFQKMFYHAGQSVPLFFWRSHEGLEVDIIIERGLKLFPIEIKMTGTPSSAHAEGLIRLRKLSDLFVPEGVLVTNRAMSVPIAGNVTSIHWSAIG